MKINLLLILCFPIALIQAQKTNGVRIGYPERDPNIDVLPGFETPPKGYGEVPFYWWMGDTLTREHLTYHLDLLKAKGISSLQVNYAHSDKGGKSWGLTFRSKPAIFSEEWWNLFGWFIKEAKKRGMTVSLSDYTLGVGQEQFVDEALAEHPEITGSELQFEKKLAKGDFSWKMPQKPIFLKAYHFTADSALVASSAIDLLPLLKENQLDWKVPAGEWIVTCIYSKIKNPSYNPMHPLSGKMYIKHFFQKFEDRFPEESKDGINFFFSDELNFHLNGFLWDDSFQKEFLHRKGYDILPHLAALYMKAGPLTAKYRLDYNDVMVSLSEKNFFEPIYRWHEDRGLIYGCDHGGRGLDVTEFGDYFRTQRWNQGPGCDQSHLAKNVIKNKVASSIAHMYNRPRTWLEGFYGSGWGTSSAMLQDAIFANFVQGQNLLSLHGLYYSTPGGWWEWAPPCNHFRMPYWEEMPNLLACTERLSYLLSQGYHRADVALLYPVEPVIAGDGKSSVECAFKLGHNLYDKGIDFDFMDYESLARAEVKGQKLLVSGEEFRVLIIPSMQTIRYASLLKAIEFQRAGGIVLCVDMLPTATEKGEMDNKLLVSAKELFQLPSVGVLDFLEKNLTPDFKTANSIKPNVMHRKIGQRDVYAVYNVKKGTPCFFRSHGEVELWDPWTGKTEAISTLSSDNKGTNISMPLDSTEIQLIVFNPATEKKTFKKIQFSETLVQTIPVTGKWETEIIPTLDNKWGDFHWPATQEKIGAEIRQIHYSSQTVKNWNLPSTEVTDWATQSVGYGTYFLCMKAIDKPLNETVILNNLKKQPWEPYNFSWRWGVEGDYGHQGYHGLKAEMYDEFIRLGKIQDVFTELQRVNESTGKHYYLYTNVIAPKEGDYELLCGEKKPISAYLNGHKMAETKDLIHLKKGANSLLLHYEGACTTYLLFRNPALKGQFATGALSERPISMPWNGDLSLLQLAVNPDVQKIYYRFVSAPGLQGLSFTAYAKKIKVWIDGKQAVCKKIQERNDGASVFMVTPGKLVKEETLVAMEIETSKAGVVGGAVFPYPIKQICGKGIMALGDWSLHEGLQYYSGGIWFSKSVEINQFNADYKWILDLENVLSTVEVWINDKKVGVKMAAPWQFDVTKYLTNGKNNIEIKVYNTASNHYLSIPTMYRGKQTSGILGNVQLKAYK